jgi:hypothetical protein
MATQQELYETSCNTIRLLQEKRNTDRATIDELYGTVRSLRKQSDHQAIKDLETEVKRMRTDLQHTHLSPVKKMILGIGLAFLSASAARYWINKIEPVIQAYVSQHSPEQVYFATIDKILAERH